ncbi:MAG: hypothetical protein ACFCUI_05800 [Bernardetiaceae bacterium]
MTSTIKQITSLLFLIFLYQQETTHAQTFKLVQAEGHVFSFEVPLDWQMGQATLPSYDMIMGTSPDSSMQVYAHQYQEARPLLDAFQTFLLSLKPHSRTMAQYARTTFDDNEEPVTAYFAKGHGQYEEQLRGFMLAGYQIEGKLCLVLVLCPPNQLTTQLPLMRHILQL